MASQFGAEKALYILKSLPRVALGNLRSNHGAKKKSKRGQGIYGGKTHGCGSKRMTYLRVGYETGNTPFYLRFPIQNYYTGHHLKLSYIPLTLERLQLMVDTNRIRTDIQVDVVQLFLTGLFKKNCDYSDEGGFALEHEGLDSFQAKLNIEVQWASEPAIAAVERSGGTITTAFYDQFSLRTARNPEDFLKSGSPIPRRFLPPQNLIEYYSDPKNRGYLADPDLIAEERLALSQKYGYILPDIKQDPQAQVLMERKDPRQVFYGLNPGWIVNLVDKVILKNKDTELQEYYHS